MVQIQQFSKSNLAKFQLFGFFQFKNPARFLEKFHKELSIMKMYKTVFFACLVLSVFSCSKEKMRETPRSITYKDGAYKAASSIKDDWGGTAEVEIRVTDGKITECVFFSYEKDGSLKDENYGKTDGIIKNAGLYKIAQTAILRAEGYGKKLVETQDIEKVDVIAGATVSYKLFKDAAEAALADAKKE